MSWEKRKLKDCCISIADGDHQPPPKSEKGIPFVTIANIVNNQFDFENSMFVPESYYENIDNKRKAQKGDILYSVVGSFGIPVFIKEDKPFVFQRHIAILRPNKNIDSRFLYYTMLSRDFYMKADASAIGAAQRTISLTALRNIEITVPPIETQRWITDILSAYDDLIENNRKQIKLLEEAAQRLYKEWFVDLRFPGHEHTKIVDGIPEGWKRFRFSDKVEILSGGTPKTDNPLFYGGNIPFFTPKDYNGTLFSFKTAINITNEGLEHCNSQLFPENTIVITARGTVGKTTLLAVPMAMNQSCYAIRSTELNAPYYLLFSLNQEIQSLKAMSNGGVFNTIIVKTFNNIYVLIPPPELLYHFEHTVTPLMKLIKEKMQTTFILTEARSKLLQKLIGQGSVNINEVL